MRLCTAELPTQTPMVEQSGIDEIRRSKPRRLVNDEGGDAWEAVADR